MPNNNVRFHTNDESVTIPFGRPKSPMKQLDYRKLVQLNYTRKFPKEEQTWWKKIPEEIPEEKTGLYSRKTLYISRALDRYRSPSSTMSLEIVTECNERVNHDPRSFDAKYNTDRTRGTATWKRM